MSDEQSNKIVIELDADTGKFSTKIGEVHQGMRELGEKGGFSLESLSLKALGLNTAFELAHKALELYHKGLENLEKVQAWDNQSVALRNVGAQVGLTSKQIETLISLIVKSTEGTVTSVQAQDSAFKLLNAGFKAETIPQITKYAELLEKARGIPFAQTVEAMSNAMMTGNGRALKPFEIAIGNIGDRAKLTEAILKGIQNQSERFGEGYSDSALKIKTRSEEAWNSVSRFFAKVGEKVAFSLFSDSADQASARISFLKDKLKELDEAQSKGQKEMTIMPGITTEVMSIEAARKKINDEIAASQKVVSDSRHKETEELKEQQELLGKQKGEVRQPLTQQAAAKEAAKVDKEIAEQRYQNNLVTEQELYSKKRALIEQNFQEEVQKLAAEPQTKRQFHARLIELEKEKYAAIDGLRVTDRQAQEAKENAELSAMDNNNLKTEQAQEKHIQLMIGIEDRKYNESIQKLRMEVSDKDEYAKQLEEKELQHQLRIQKIKEDHAAFTSANIKRGWFGAMADMEKRQGGWAGMTGRIAQKSANVMSKSFIDMAKAHKFSMDQMLNNFLEMIGESMIEDGSFKLLAGLFPPNPGMLAVGAAEVAAGAVLVGSSSSATGSASGGGSTGGTDTNGQPQQLSSQQMDKKQASIIIHGDILGNRETANYLADTIRQNSDITDYTITAQGKSYS